MTARNTIIVVACFFAAFHFSCTKDPLTQQEAEWINVLTDSTVTFAGKIRSDSKSNLYCSYSYRGGLGSDNSAIVKLSPEGNLGWRKTFNSVGIYDFAVDEEDNLIVASASGVFVDLMKITSEHDSVTIGTFQLPLGGMTISEVVNMRIFITEEGNYNINGTMQVTDSLAITNGFIMEIDPTGAEVWKQSYFFPQNGSSGTAIGGCCKTADGYMVLGYNQSTDPAVSSFFVMKTNGTGDTLWTRTYATSSYNADSETYSGYYCATSNLVKGNDGNFYGGVYNVLYNTPGQFPLSIYTSDDMSARIYQISPEGDTLSRVSIKNDVQNLVTELVAKDDGGLLVGMNPYRLINYNVVGERHSFVASINSSFDLEGITTIQSQYSDYLGSLCNTADNHYAILTMIQSWGYEYNKLSVIKTDENGNF